MNNTKHMVAFDCGNSSCRVVLGTYDGNRISMEVITQVPNEMMEIDGIFYWDFEAICRNLKRGLGEAVRRTDHIDSLGICTWGVDFGLFDKEGRMIGLPLSYRNTIGEKALSAFSAEEQEEMFMETGILCDKINSAWMLAGMKEVMPQRLREADKILMVPDILNYMFTGRMLNEPSELSTTQFMEASTGKISSRMCRRLGIPESLFCETGIHGEIIGHLLPSIREELGIGYEIPVVCVPSHDTAAAVFAVPAAEDSFLFVSSGTWSLIGTELDKPVITRNALAGKLTNETGAFGKITLLRNNAGMFINQRLKPEYEAETGRKTGWTEFSELGLQHEGRVPLFDVNDVRFFNPVSMSGAIRSYLLESGQTTSEADWPTIIRSYQVSLAASYAQVCSALEQLSGKRFPVVYIAGGGSRNILQNRTVADVLGRPVMTGSEESTSFGCLAAQLPVHVPGIDVQGMRNILRSSIEVREYLPQQDLTAYAEAYVARFGS
ncbi:MAG: hypothetical protein IKF51_09390 [Solobacterium sp.]|nr:hypothetical protein [Solobacterium sp.]